MKVNEIFESIQGEGRYVGTPALFIRLAGCNLNCSYCDTDHKEFKSIPRMEIVHIINKCNLGFVVWTGGEPTLQMTDIMETVTETKDKIHHIETNGTILDIRLREFDYVVMSPKYQTSIYYFKKLMHGIAGNHEIKIVTDLNMNKHLLSSADSIMPLTTGDKDKDFKIKQEVWDYCVEHNVRYSPRLHIDLDRK